MELTNVNQSRMRSYYKSTVGSVMWSISLIDHSTLAISYEECICVLVL